ncbi:tetrapyrrole biosynthesis, uroporphyrinogen III synthase [Fennellomyces sp. T-0311]|nr:tetrapyrrole biosynthesis, uroporphyrinogen III synthase [Fennellomyces sp. T-0311]
MPSVLLFKQKDQPDEYSPQLEQHGYTAEFIPVLDSQSESVPYLQELLASPPAHGGIIFTSQRSVDTWATVITAPKIDPQWRTIAVFIVGSKTAEKLGQLAFFKELTIVGDRATQLADQMVPYLREHTIKLSLLFLAGDKRLNELPTRLNKSNIAYQEVRTYSTCAHPQLSERLLTCGSKDWGVFFSPSGVNYVLERDPDIMRKIGKLAAIGPTTASHMEKHGLKVSAVAEKPRAAQVAKAIAQG